MWIRFFLLLLALTVCNAPAWATPLLVGKQPTPVTLEGDLGGKVSGDPWRSDEIPKAGKVVSLFYIDPEERRSNEPLEEAYQIESLPKDKHLSFAIINMAAAWYPNSFISSELRKKQVQFPQAIYVMDMKKTLVKEWGLKDDSVNLVIFGKDGNPLLIKHGPLSKEEIPSVMKLIRDNL